MAEYTSKQEILDAEASPNPVLVQDFRQIVAAEPNRGVLTLADNTDYLAEYNVDGPVAEIVRMPTTLQYTKSTSTLVVGSGGLKVRVRNGDTKSSVVTVSAGTYAIPTAFNSIYLPFTPATDTIVVVADAPFTSSEKAEDSDVQKTVYVGSIVPETNSFILVGGLILHDMRPWESGYDYGDRFPEYVTYDRASGNSVYVNGSRVSFTITSPTTADVSGTFTLYFPSTAGVVKSTSQWSTTVTTTNPVVIVDIPTQVTATGATHNVPVTVSAATWGSVASTYAGRRRKVIGFWDTVGSTAYPDEGDPRMFYTVCDFGSVIQDGEETFLGRGANMSSETLAQKIKAVTEFPTTASITAYKSTLGYDPERTMLVPSTILPPAIPFKLTDRPTLPADALVSSTTLQRESYGITDLSARNIDVKSLRTESSPIDRLRVTAPNGAWLEYEVQDYYRFKTTTTNVSPPQNPNPSTPFFWGGIHYDPVLGKNVFTFNSFFPAIIPDPSLMAGALTLVDQCLTSVFATFDTSLPTGLPIRLVDVSGPDVGVVQTSAFNYEYKGVTKSIYNALNEYDLTPEISVAQSSVFPKVKINTSCLVATKLLTDNFYVNRGPVKQTIAPNSFMGGGTAASEEYMTKFVKVPVPFTHLTGPLPGYRSGSWTVPETSLTYTQLLNGEDGDWVFDESQNVLYNDPFNYVIGYGSLFFKVVRTMTTDSGNAQAGDLVLLVRSSPKASENIGLFDAEISIKGSLWQAGANLYKYCVFTRIGDYATSVGKPCYSNNKTIHGFLLREALLGDGTRPKYIGDSMSASSHGILNFPFDIKLYHPKYPKFTSDLP